MCLLLQKHITDDLKKEKYIIGYKLLQVCDARTKLKSYVYPFEWQPGWNHATEAYAPFYCGNEFNSGFHVHSGFHVYLNAQDAINNLNATEYATAHLRVVSVTCCIKDLIQAGVFSEDRVTAQAVFKRVFLKKKNYEYAIKR